jgi:hypothetical protein
LRCRVSALSADAKYSSSGPSYGDPISNEELTEEGIEMAKTMQTETTVRVTERVDRALAALHARAVHLRSEARTCHPVLATAYRPRAAELELGAWAMSVRVGRPPGDYLAGVAA